MTEHNQILTLTVVSQETTLHKSSIYRGIKEGTFPKPIKLGARRIGWFSADIAAWLQNKAQNN